jgi:hypothetical protein
MHFKLLNCKIRNYVPTEIKIGTRHIFPWEQIFQNVCVQVLNAFTHVLMEEY